VSLQRTIQLSPSCESILLFGVGLRLPPNIQRDYESTTLLMGTGYLNSVAFEPPLLNCPYHLQQLRSHSNHLVALCYRSSDVIDSTAKSMQLVGWIPGSPSPSTPFLSLFPRDSCVSPISGTCSSSSAGKVGSVDESVPDSKPSSSSAQP
jgi:hypothetical protein